MSVKKLMQLYEGIVGQVPDADIAQDIEMRRYVPLKNTGYKAQLGVKLSADISSVTIHQGKNAPQLFSARHWHAGTLLVKIVAY